MPEEIKKEAPLLEFAGLLLNAEAVRMAAQAVVSEWDDGTLTTKEGFSCAGIAVSCLRDALNGYLPLELLEKLYNR